MGKNQSASNLTNVIQISSTGNVLFVSGSTTLMSISSSGAITTTGVISGSNALSASYAVNADTLDGLDSTVFTLTSSFNAQTASFTAFTASILSQTASLNLFSASILATTASLNSFSASILSYTSSINAKTASFATTGSNTFIGTQTISGSVLQSGSFTTTGTIIAQTINVQQVTSSVIYSSGSNIFGNAIGDSQKFTGSVLITGSLTIAAGGNASAPTIYGSTAVCSPVGLFSGCVGIGTATPKGLLQLYGAEVAAYKTYTGQGNTGGGDAIINAYRLDSSNLYLRVTDIVALGDDTNNRGSSIRLMTTNTSGVTSAALTLASTGYVGIGTTTPCAYLHISTAGVAGQNTPNIRLTDSSVSNNGGNVYISADKQGVGYNNLTAIAYSYTFKGGASATNYLTIDTNGVSCFAGAVCAQQLIGISSATVNGPIYFQNGGNTYFQQYVGSSCDLVIYNTTNNGMFVYTNSAQRLGIAGNGSAVFACQVCVKSLVTTNGNISQSQNGVKTQTFFATKSVPESTTSAFFRITTSGASSTHVQLVSSNAAVGWYASQIYHAGNSSYWGGYIGSGASISIAGGSSGYISGIYSDNAGAQNYCVTTSNNGTSTSNLIIAYITVTAADSYGITFTQL
jgi:hypothetical protein